MHIRFWLENEKGRDSFEDRRRWQGNIKMNIGDILLYSVGCIKAIQVKVAQLFTLRNDRSSYQ
jgi:hypothetical protein